MRYFCIPNLESHNKRQGCTMKRFVLKFFATYGLFVLLFAVQKPIFMCWYHDLYTGTTFSDWMAAIAHGLPLDCSIAGYLTAIPGLLLVVSAWTNSRAALIAEKIYFGIISVVLSIIFVVDIALYGYWGFRLDATPLFYFLSSPPDAFASVSTGYAVAGFAVIIAVAIVYYALFSFLLSRICLHRPKTVAKRIIAIATALALTGLLFIPIRGGFTVSTMNLSHAYFSQNQRLNHAAINPAFSFMYSATHQNDFGSQYRYMDAETADRLFSEMEDRPVQHPDSVMQLFTSQRPDIFLVILESFSSHLMPSLGGEQGIAACIDSLAQEGILFTDFYANSFRTDRGLTSIISGYPAQPNTSIMKYVEKAENLPSIPRSLKNAGYDLAYYYGGDANFTNMQAYLVSAGFDKIISDKDFPIADRSGKWGAHDHLVYNRCLNDLPDKPQRQPLFRIIQTSSSHEPFDVPYTDTALKDKAANAFAYTDSCTGDFVRKLKTTTRWDNSIVILVPDHYGAYPANLEDPMQRHRIPLVIIGGAVRQPCKIGIPASQIDLAATLLYQLGIPHEEFTFSKNILNPDSPHFGYFTEPSLFGFAAKDNKLVYNCDANAVISDEGPGKGTNIEKGKAFLQKLYDDLATR